MERKKKRVSAILLGAGQSTRMGEDKLRLPLGKKVIFQHCLDALLDSEVEQVNIIFSKPSRALQECFAPSRRIKLVQNRQPQRGMSGSIRKGLNNLDPGVDGALIALGDQPLLKKRTINALIRAFHPGEGEIVVPVYQGRRGNPVLFDRTYFEELLRLRGDAGGRSVMQRHPDKIVRVRTKSEAVVKDIDTPEEYEKLAKDI